MSLETDINLGAITEALNGKVDIDSSWGFPSDTYENLTLGANGSSYIAPANGYVSIARNASAADQYVIVYIKDSNGNWVRAMQVNSTSQQTRCRVIMPVKKGQEYFINYTAAYDDYFRFIYAVGSESEASS